MRIFTLTLALIMLTMAASARRYYTGIGLRAGKFSSGVSFKHFYNTDNATGVQIDAMYSNMSADGFTLKAYYLKQIPFKLPIIQLPLDLVLGAGLHGAYFPFQNNNGYYKIGQKKADRYTTSVITAGVDATVQIEYRIPLKKVPFTFGIDCNPFYEFYNPGPEWIDFGIAIRYVFL
jgi:hypothetical protein